MFNTVEGNATVYRVPDAESVLRWREAVAGTGFRSCFKLPRDGTHERKPGLGELDRFLQAIEPLHDVLGPLLVQFPATMGPDDIDRYTPIFETLYSVRRLVIDVRHPAFSATPALLAPKFERRGAGRVVLDSRPLYEGDRRHPEVSNAIHEKPGVPVLPHNG